MRKGRANAAAVEVHHAAMLAAGEDHAPAEGVVAPMVDQAGFEQHIERIVLGSEMTMYISAGSIADAQFLEERRIAQATLLEIARRFRMAVQLQLIEGHGFFQHAPGISRSDLLLEVGDRLAEGEALG